jgi:hypothetical protein
MRKSQLNGKAQPFLTTGGEAVANNNGFGCSSAALRNLGELCGSAVEFRPKTNSRRDAEYAGEPQSLLLLAFVE